ncbi:MAG: PEP-CTERM sorting domain-containing protein [Planctomycetales bacterium]|nr:PEP-CTERM sorting domain-containing protein [Planctomycetales bacterium]
MRKHIFRWALLAVLFGATSASLSRQANAQGNFTYQGAIGAGQTWELGTNWNDTTFLELGEFPGQDDLTDTANLSIDLGGNALGVNIGTPITIGTLIMGDTNAAPSATTIGGNGTLTVGAITSQGTAGASNNIQVDLLTANTTISGSNSISFNNITVAGGGSKTFRSSLSGATTTINGTVSLSDTAGSAGNLLFRQDNDANVMVFNSAIVDGAQAGTGVAVRYARGTFEHMVDNTYSGTTQLGENSPNSAATHIIHTNGAFSTGRVVFGGGAAIKTVQGATGAGDRTLANEIQLSRDGRFAGSENIALTGKIFQSNTRSLINDIGAGKSLTISGPVFTDSGTNVNDLGRVLTFSGTGTTVVSGSIDDKDGTPAANRGQLRYNGTGTLLLDNGFSADYAGATIVNSGTVRLGSGGAPVGLNNHSIQGGDAGTGTVIINHNGSLALDASMGGNLTVQHVGTGTTQFNAPSFGTGNIIATDGKIMINGGTFAGSAGTAARDPLATGNTAIMGNLPAGFTAGLRVGQTLSLTPAAGNGFAGTVPTDLYVMEVLSGNSVLLSGNIPSDNVNGVNNWDMTFNAGTGTGTANVVAALNGEVGGNGVIGGNLTVATAGATAAPGASIGTLTVMGNTSISGILEIEFDGAGAGSIDLLDTTGTLTLAAGSTLNLVQLGASADDAAYVFATYGTLSGTFTTVNNLPSGYTVNYAYNGNSIALVSAVPEPSGLLALASGLGLAFVRRRRSK